MNSTALAKSIARMQAKLHRLKVEERRRFSGPARKRAAAKVKLWLRAVRRAREAHGLSQEDVGLYLGLTRASVSNIEGGRQKLYQWQVFLLNDLLGMDRR